MEREQPVRVGRRLAAIVAADVAGYSRLMGLDEVGTARTLREHRQVTDALVAKHGGRLVKTTGDGVLLEFPSVVDAVECAVAVQATMAERNQDVPPDRQMRFRIGINLGDILIEGDDILGDGVNVAARLEGIADPGGICLSSSAYEQVRGKVHVEFTELGEQTLKNIARPVQAYSIRLATSGAQGAPAPHSAPRLSIVVLPFLNIGGVPEQDYFVDGVTESLTTDLSRISGAFVIARNTAFTFKGKAVDVKKLGSELNVRYVLEGSVQRGGNRLRVNVQLIDASSGNHLWAERFEKPLADLFDLQDEIVSQLANALNSQLIEFEARRVARTPHPDATDLYFQGAAWLNAGQRPDDLRKARSFFERALQLEPGNVEALLGTAQVDALMATTFLTDDRAERLAAAELAATTALSFAPNNPRAHFALGSARIFTDRVLQGIRECELALALDRNLARAYGMIGVAKLLIGQGHETEAHIRQAIRLSPRDSFLHVWAMYVGLANFLLRDDAQAVEWYRRSVEVNRNYPLAQFFLGAALAQVGDLAEARATALEALALNPSFTIRRFRSNSPSNHPAYLSLRERLYEGLRLAGVPEE
ncbi:adenylate/guanylate cyclase domain-containing protein [Bradyrhizobium manausense]|uniref:adenylate/guanylate cyclase domain-containing protein n=1 Tax=Bradyrhizobium manausense TaxID=989370 RepID=UPI001BAA1499|nr:adenylate/guanylate cyclase domain-containing protein [Bradyrhizobium manausense]MBR0790275.1 adenylate/guanylate cyclase domain-containing protein [Bradyrhizobium manausense]